MDEEFIRLAKSVTSLTKFAANIASSVMAQGSIVTLCDVTRMSVTYRLRRADEWCMRAASSVVVQIAIYESVRVAG